MLIIIMTRDRYLEYGLMRILSGYQVTTGRELFNAGKQRQSLPEDSYVILCDRNLERLTYSMFCGRRFLVIPVSSVRCLTDIRQTHPPWSVAVRTYGKATDPDRDGGGLRGCFP